MIYGVGVDLCDVRRIAQALQRHGARFAQRILTPAEYARWQERSARVPARGVRYLATRFAAKEAFSKAIGLGLRGPMRWQSCEVGRLPSGQPAYVLHDALAQWFAARALAAHLSLSDEGDLACAYCVVERLAASPGPGA